MLSRREPTRRGRYQDRLLECQAGKSPYWIFPFSNSACAVPIRKKLMAAQPGEGDSGRRKAHSARWSPSRRVYNNCLPRMRGRGTTEAGRRGTRHISFHPKSRIPFWFATRKTPKSAPLWIPLPPSKGAIASRGAANTSTLARPPHRFATLQFFRQASHFSPMPSTCRFLIRFERRLFSRKLT